MKKYTRVIFVATVVLWTMVILNFCSCMSTTGPAKQQKTTTSPRTQVTPQAPISVDQIDLNNRNAMIGTDIDVAYRGKGYGRRSHCLITDYLFRQLGMHRIWLVTLSTNDVAISMYRKLGMKEEGVWRDAIWRDNGYVDLIQFGVIREEWVQSSGK